MIPVVVLGAGPAGLGAAYKLAQRRAFRVTVIERSQAVGGNAGSFDLAGIRVDYGSHRLHPSCAPEILADIRSMLRDELLDRPRHGRIRLRGRWVHFPLKPADLALHLPPGFLLGVARDSIMRRRGKRTEETFESVLEAGLGRTICRDFYFPYAHKIWGVSPSSLDPEQARRRVAAGSLGKMARKILAAVPGLKPKGAGRFFYPRRGYGAISEAYLCAAKRAGADVIQGLAVSSVEVENGRVTGVRAADGYFPARYVLSTIPLPVLVRSITPGAPRQILSAAAALRFRSMVLVYLVLETERFTEYDAHYFPGPEAPITRLSEPKNYGLAVLPSRTVLCAELPCDEDDAVWTASDAELGKLVVEALAQFGLPVRAPVLDVSVRRLRHAYPIYTRDYREHFDLLDNWVGGIEGVITFGRQGLFAHDNTHHALAMAYALNGCLTDDGQFDAARWTEHRREFQRHVVED